MRSLAAVLLLAALACGGGERAATAGSTSAADAGAGSASGATSSPATGPAGTARPACAHTGRWDACTIAERLDHSGLAPRALEKPAADATLGNPTLGYTVGRSDLLVWIYPDRKARESAQAKLDRKGYLTPDEEVGMTPLPTLIASENLLALLDSRNEHQRERVADAITAGPPQPSR